METRKLGHPNTKRSSIAESQQAMPSSIFVGKAKREKKSPNSSPTDIHNKNEKNKVFLFAVDSRTDELGNPVSKLPVNIRIYDYDMVKLQGHIEEPSLAKCLNDEILNYAITSAVNKNFPGLIDSRWLVRVAPTTFYTTLSTPFNKDSGDEDSEKTQEHLDSYCRVLNYLTTYDYFSMDWVFVPINEAYHWSGVVVVRPNALLSPSTAHLCKVLHVDSLNGHHDTEEIGETLKHYVLQAFFDDRNAAERDKHDEVHMRTIIGEIEVIKVRASQQPNGFDCGVYVNIFFGRLLKAYKESADAGLVLLLLLLFSSSTPTPPSNSVDMISFWVQIQRFFPMYNTTR